MTWRSFMKVALGGGLVAAALTTTTVGPAVAQGVLKPVQAFIVNTSADPVPVSVVSSPQVVPQLWPGVPFSLGRIVFNDLGGIQKCVEAFEAPPIKPCCYARCPAGSVCRRAPRDALTFVSRISTGRYRP